MTGKERMNLAAELSAVSIFRDVIKKQPLAALIAYCKNEDNAVEAMRLYGEFVSSLEDFRYSFSDFLLRAVYEDENPYVTDRAQNLPVSDVLQANADGELALFSKLTRLTAAELTEGISYDGYVPRFINEETDLGAAYRDRLANIRTLGYGVFASSCMFRVKDGEIVPVESADTITKDRFVGYDTEREQVFRNTEALICGRPAANILLYGDAGTGKSSTVKACANHYYEKGVRLIEIRKDQLFELSRVMGRIANNPLKFIIFIDDLSFNKNDDNFSMLKAALEGSASAKASNAVIYATSNRRHIVKETFSDRGSSDDVHHSDTVQELMSLSDRFGLTVYFERPNKQLYLTIVRRLAADRGIEIAQDELARRAETYALAKGFRSPRAAEQFVDSLQE
ncbi:MAG: ATP-binding protein [Lachnospiraceae bacterium]|nr:ATP-binding protein [Lachnospiraceae bacterium]